MIIMVDRSSVDESDIFASLSRTGVAAARIQASDFGDWVSSASECDIGAIDAVVLGDCPGRSELTRLIRRRSAAAIIALDNTRSVDKTLKLFEAGVDDVVGDPCDVREILARVAAITRRAAGLKERVPLGDIHVFRDGRDPIVGGELLPLPRRELRILEYLVSNTGRRVSKSQIFSSVYGLFESEIDENVIESHISKLRKRLRARLGYDPINSKRHLGYMLSRE